MKVNRNRQMMEITEKIRHPVGDIDEVIDYLRVIKELYGKHTNVKLGYSPAAFWGDAPYTVTYSRLETDEEYGNRLAKEQRILDYLNS